MKHKIWFLSGVMSALVFGAFANIPNSPIHGSMAVTPEVSEIRVKRQSELSFDQDLKQLSSIQGRYRENLPVRRGGKRDAIRMRQSSPQRPSSPTKTLMRGKPTSQSKRAKLIRVTSR